MPKISDKQLLQFLQDAVMDKDLYCPFCGARIYEPDYDKCIECGEPNPLKKAGMI